MQLVDIVKYKNGVNKTIYFLAWLDEKIKNTGNIPPILTMGSAVQFYTAGNYPSETISLAVSDISVTECILEKANFIKRAKKYFLSDYGILVMFSNIPPQYKTINVRYLDRILSILAIEDVIIERLNIAKLQNTYRELEWAKVIYSSIGVFKPNEDYLNKRIAEEDVVEQFNKALSLPLNNVYPTMSMKTYKPHIYNIDFQDIGLNTEGKVNLLERSDLSSRSWSKEQLNVFIERQKFIIQILAGLGIEIISSDYYKKSQ